MAMGYSIRAAAFALAMAFSAGANAAVVFNETFDGKTASAIALSNERFSQLTATEQADRDGSVGFGKVSKDAVSPIIDNIVAMTTAVPEPGTWALMMAGFGLAGVLIRRSRQGAVSFS